MECSKLTRENKEKLDAELFKKLSSHLEYSLEMTITDFLLGLNASTSKRVDIKNYSLRHKNFNDLSFRIEELRILLRLSFETKVISIGHYNNLLEKVDQIGRELGGLIKYNLKQMEMAGGNSARKG